MYVAMSSSLLALHKDFLMAEFKFMQVKTTFDDKLNESTAGADASVEVPKLHNIKASFYQSMLLYTQSTQ